MTNTSDKKPSPVSPLDAATVILLRETSSVNPFELLLMRRHAKQSFMGKAFVYPGGQLDEEDRSPGLAAYAEGITAQEAKKRLNEPDISDEKALGILFAAVRETYEESGVLLAGLKSGKEIDFKDPQIGKRFAEYRTMIHRREMTLEDLAKKESLVFRLDQLVPFAHWITPELERKRFDARFLLAPIPAGQEPVHDSREMTETLWTTPGEALVKQKANEILLMPPTLKTLEEMSRFSSVADLLSFAASLTIQTILPQISFEGASVVIKLPHDPEYTLEAYKQPHRPEEISRVVFADNRVMPLKFGER